MGWVFKTATGHKVVIRAPYLEDALALFRKDYPHVAIESINPQ